MGLSILRRWRERRDSKSTPAIRSASERKLEASIRRLKILEYLSAAVVVVGVAKESFAIFMWVWARSGLWSAVQIVWGGIAVGVGVAAETLFSMMVSSREGKLHSIEAQKRVEAEEKTAEALLEVAELQRENLELQKAVAPRRIYIGSALKPLRQFPGIHFAMKEVSDFEARRVALYLSAAFKIAGWTLDGNTVTRDDGLQDGITIYVHRSPEGRELAATLVEYLGDVQSDWQEELELPSPKHIRVEVGFKPPYPQVPLIWYPPEDLP